MNGANNSGEVNQANNQLAVYNPGIRSVFGRIVELPPAVLSAFSGVAEFFNGVVRQTSQFPLFHRLGTFSGAAATMATRNLKESAQDPQYQEKFDQLYRQMTRESGAAPMAFTPEALIAVLSKDECLRACFSMNAGVSEGYTVGQHTQMVLETAFRFKETLQKEVTPLVDWFEFLVFLALHDIGKGQANTDNNQPFSSAATFKDDELENTKTILKETMEKLEFTPEKISLFCAMLTYDAQGLYLRDHIGQDEIVDNVLEMAKACEADPVAFYSLFGAYHMADAASYPGLMGSIFETKGSVLSHCAINANKIAAVQEELEKTAKGEKIFFELLRGVENQEVCSKHMEKFNSNIEPLHLFLRKMHKEMLRGGREHEKYRAVLKGFRDMIHFWVAGSEKPTKFHDQYSQRIKEPTHFNNDCGALITLVKGSENVIAFEYELIDFRKNYLCRYSVDKIRRRLQHEEEFELLGTTFLHGSNAGILPNLLPTGMQLMPSGRLSQLGVVPFSGELAEGANKGGINRYRISGTAMDAAGRAISYATNKSFHTSIESEKQSLIRFIEDKEIIIKEKPAGIFQSIRDTCCYPEFWTRNVTAVYRLRTLSPSDYEGVSQRLSQVVQRLEEDWGKFTKTTEYREHMPKALDPWSGHPFMALGYNHHDYYYYKKFECIESAISGFKKAMTDPVTRIEGVEEAIQNPYGLIFASHSLHAPIASRFATSERIALKAAKIGKDIQMIFVKSGDIDPLTRFLDGQGLAEKVSVVDITRLHAAVETNKKLFSYFCDFASKKKLDKRFGSKPV